MNARLREYALLWRAASSHADSSHSAIVRWGGSFIALALASAAWEAAGPRGALLLAWCLAWGAILLTWT